MDLCMYCASVRRVAALSRSKRITADLHLDKSTRTLENLTLQ